MNRTTPTEKDYDILLQMFGSHTAAAKFLGITPGAYRTIRRTGRMTPSCARLILVLTRPGDRPAASAVEQTGDGPPEPWATFERRKQKLAEQGLPPSEYEQAVGRLALELGI